MKITNEKGSLLVCIAFHYSRERLRYLDKIISEFIFKYKCPVHIIVDTNTFDLDQYDVIGNIEVCVHEDLQHPFHLTWQHRKHIKDNIDKYDNFMYIEDDMLLPYENYINYLENFKILYPKYVPSFVRIEEKEWQEFISDIPKRQPKEFIEVGGKTFHAFKFPYNYHAFWIMPQKELKESMKDDFVKLSDGREFAAMYTGWESGKPALVEIENGQISKKSYSFHLPNNYALSEGTPNGKIKPENIFI